VGLFSAPLRFLLFHRQLFISFVVLHSVTSPLKFFILPAKFLMMDSPRSRPFGAFLSSDRRNIFNSGTAALLNVAAKASHDGKLHGFSGDV